MKRAYILIPGILTHTDDRLAWAVKMADDIMLSHDNARASEFRYFCDAIFRRLGQQERARHVAALIERYYDAGFSVVCVGHSNGCDLLLRALNLMTAHVEGLHLISGACEASFEYNGLNEALKHGRVGRVAVYASKSDSALGFWARLSGRISAGIVGYGHLGWSGPAMVCAEVADRVDVIRRDYFEHGDWFANGHYRDTLNAVTVLERMHAI